jgi:hypothetical protein
MANITGKDTNLKDLRQRASKLVSGVESLAALFEQEEIRSRRRNEVVRLKALCSAVLQRMERARGEEMAASYGHSKAETVSSLFRLSAGLITMTSENRTMRAVSRQLLTGSSGREPPYGTVIVRIGPKGLPEDVEVVSISSLARESKQNEPEIMGRLLARGNLLFGEETFSRLIDRLAGEILGGRLSLPVSADRLSQLQ